MSQSNATKKSKIQLYSVPNYKTASWGTIKISKEKHIDINAIDQIMKWGSDKCLHENIEQDVIRLNVDIDGTDVNIEEIYDIVVQTCNDLLGVDVDVFYTENNGYKKAGKSHHLVVDGISCNRKTQIHFWQNIQKLHPDKDFKFDIGHLRASRSLYRFPYQQKECVLDTEHIILYGELKSFVLNYVTECVDVTETLNELYRKDIDESVALEKALNTHKNMDNVVMEATDDNILKIREFSELLPGNYIHDYHDWRNMVWSVRAMGEGFKMMAIEISQRSSGYSSHGFMQVWKNYKDNRGNKITSNSFFYFCKEGGEQEFKALCKKWNMAEIDRESKKEIDEYFVMDKSCINYKTETSKYICCDVNNRIKMNADLLSHKHLVLKADMGKGKTQFIKKILEYGNLVNGNRKPNVLFISSRKSFANFICSEFDVNNYLDFVEDTRKYRKCNKLCVQLESLVKIDESVDYDHVILDECESILKQFSSPTLKQVGLTYSIFESVIKKAKKVVYADAFISNRTLNYIREIRTESEKIYMIHNTVPAIFNKQAIQIPSTKYETTIINMLKADKNLFTPTCSKTKSDGLEIKTLRECPNKKSIFYHSDNDDKVTDTLKDVNGHWINYNLVSCTPTMTVGVSCDLVGHFNNTVLDARNAMGPVPRDVIQMIRRVRHTDGNLIFALPHHMMMKCERKHTYKLISDLNDENREKIDIIKESLATEDKPDASVNASLDRLLECTTEGLKIILHGNLRENVMAQFHFKNMLLELLSLIGYEVKTCEELKKDKVEDDKKFGRDYEKEFDDIVDIPHDQITLIVSLQKKKHVRSMQPRIDKYFFNDKFGTTIDKSLRAEIFFNVYQNRYKKYVINNLQYEKSNLTHLEKTELELEKNDHIVTTMKMTAEKSKLINSLNGIMKIDHSQDTKNVMKKKDVDKAKDYLKKNIKTVTTLYNTSVDKDSKGDAYAHLLKSIYKDWSNVDITTHTKDRTKTALTFKIKGYNYYEHIKLPSKMQNIDIFQETE
jgi:hypothetical protein